MKLDTLWDKALGQIELAVSKALFSTMFTNSKLVALKDNRVIIHARNNFACSWIEKNGKDLVLTILQQDNPQITELECTFSVQSNIPSPITNSSRKITSNNVDAPPILSSINNQTTNLNPRYTFDKFVVGQHNELAHAACSTVSNELGTSYNPLFIYGDVGLGKTHLLQSIGNAALAVDPNKRVLYMSSERFTTELIDSIHNNTISKFKKTYLEIDLLIIDDVQFLAGKEKTQDEFFHIFNILYQKNKQIVISSDRPPHSIATLAERLRSRFEGGMIADISQPDMETRVAILQKKSDEKNFLLPEDAAVYIAQNVATNVRELEGALNKVIAICEFGNKIPSVESVKDILASTITNKRPGSTPNNIIVTTADAYSVSIDDIIGKRRTQSIVRPRQIVMHLLREELSLSYPEIGMHCGGRDHTTVMHACRKIDNELKEDEILRHNIDNIRKQLHNL